VKNFPCHVFVCICCAAAGAKAAPTPLPIAVAQQAQGLDLRTCDGCDAALARAAGAKISVTGWVQKLSNLILAINLVARDVATGSVIEAGSVDIRGNTDQSWSRRLSYLLRNRLHPSNWR
jgi:hypothetical protein